MVRSTRARLVTCIAICVCAAAGAGAAQAPAVSANVRAGGIDSRQNVQAGSRIRRGRAEGIVYAPSDRVLAVIEDYAGYPRFMPHFETSRVLARRGSSALLYVQVTALHGVARLWAEVKVSARDVPPPTRFIDARMTRGNLKQFDAAWQITPLDTKRTLVAFELCADPDLPFSAAAGLVSDYNEKEARNSIHNLRQYVREQASPAP